MSASVRGEGEQDAGRGNGPGPAVATADPALLAELTTAADRLESARPEAIIAWAVERFGDRLAVAASFQDCVVIDLAVQVAPAITVVFVDTGFHFPETLEYLEQVRRHYSLNIEVLSAGLPPDEWPCGTARCCELRKVAPINGFLAGREAWVSGLKRVDTPTRAGAPVVGWDAAKGLVKVNPLATWSEDDVEEYIQTHGLLRHPLNAFGYLSIGCAPATRPVAPGEDPRSGRWAGTAKTECGLNL